MEQTISKNEKGSGYATAGLVLGIVSLITWILPLLGYPVSIVGIVMASNGLRSERKSMAGWGLGLSIVGLVATIFSSIFGVLYWTNSL